MSIAQNNSVVKRYFGHHAYSSTICLGEGLDDDYGARIRKAWRDWHDAHDRQTLSWAEIQRRIAVAFGVKETGVAVLKWKDGEQEPTVAEFRALGALLEKEPAWLAFGTLPEKPAALQDPILSVRGEMTTDPRRKRRAK